MPDPVRSIPELQWVKVAESVKYIYLYRIETTFYYYKTYRKTGSAAPDPVPDKNSIPDEAVRLFRLGNEEKIKSSEAIDVYILCAHTVERHPNTGRILVGPIDDSRDVYIQDQTSDPLIIRFNKITNSTNLAEDIALFDRTIVVSDATGISVGSYLILFNADSGNVMPCVVLDITNSPELIIDRPADYAFPSETDVDVTEVLINTDGSSVEQVFGVRGPSKPNAVGVSLDVNQIRLLCITADSVDLSLFGDLEALTSGLLIRTRKSGEYMNLLSAKTNGEILGAFGNWVPYSAANPAQGVDGFSAILTINGQDHHGVAIRLDPGDDIEIVNNENLGGLVLLEAVAIVHIVDP
jgi:hypothetical protein